MTRVNKEDDRWYRGYLEIKSFAIGFCGIEYPLVTVKRHFDGQTHYCYNIDDFDKAVTSYYNKKECRIYFSDKKSYEQNQRRDWENDFDIKTPTYNLFKEYNTPIYLCRQETTSSWMRILSQEKLLEWYHCIDSKQPNDDIITLDDLEFYRVVDPYTAFQEIQMYLSGVLGFNNPVIPEMDDETMRDIKGFDKVSFKKEKSDIAKRRKHRK